MAQDKTRGAVPHGIYPPPYHPDHPDCQLPSLALRGVACHSGCGSSLSGIDEFADGRVKTYNIEMLTAEQQKKHRYCSFKGLDGHENTHLHILALPHMRGPHQQVKLPFTSSVWFCWQNLQGFLSKIYKDRKKKLIFLDRMQISQLSHHILIQYL